MHIGLIGGIGVAATVVYYQRLSTAVASRGRSLDLTIVHADVQELIRNSLADEKVKQAKVYSELINRLKAAGADCVAITSLGGHFCYDETVKRSSLPMISAVKPLDGYFASKGYDTVGLLGTRVVMQTKLYGQLQQTRALTFEDEIETLGQIYQDMAVEGRCSDQNRELFLDAGRRMVDDLGADAIVLAGTDLNLAFDGQKPGYKVIDALDVHVDVLARLATDETTLKEAGADI
ncbi:aspartate/glutamate racemase family protein [Ruegeria arenilitoris]|uniref:aspartate/glutamate racemase family protein n=1 Tax=Ruegeria arenilitoris TaxID=1173585 RepID=UPI001479E4BD